MATFKELAAVVDTTETNKKFKIFTFSENNLLNQLEKKLSTSLP